MKIVTSNGKRKLVMSRNEWTEMGKKAGWTKEALNQGEWFANGQQYRCQQDAQYFYSDQEKPECPICGTFDVIRQQEPKAQPEAQPATSSKSNDIPRTQRAPAKTRTQRENFVKNYRDPRVNRDPNRGIVPLRQSKPMPHLSASINKIAD